MAGPRLDLIIRHGSVENLRSAIASDAAIKADAEAEMAAAMVVQKRCVISREYADVLREALNG
jgi:hypothetical protein